MSTPVHHAPPPVAPPAARHGLRAAWMMTASGWSANQFSALLDTYRSGLGLTESTVTGLVAVYVLGLVPGLLAGGPLADRVGRRPVALAALAINLASTAVLMLGSSAAWLLLPGRLLTGIGAGALLAAGSAWVKELSAPPFAEEARPGTAARRAGLFVSAGFASGGLVASLIAQWTPSPLVTGYLPHLLLAGAALVLARPAPETRSARPTGPARPAHVTDWRRFRRAVLPLAPWVFAAPSIGFVTLPGLVRGIGDLRTVYAGVATAVVPAAGLLIQPLARHLATRYRLTAAASGPAVVALGFLLAAPAAADGGPVLSLVAAAVFGAGYGLLLAFCLTEVAAVAPPHHLARVTSLFWTAAYLGMFAPYAVTLLSGAFAVSTLMIAGAALAVLTCVAVPALARSASR